MDRLQTDKPVLVTGASGRTGLLVVRALYRAGIPVRGLVRTPEKAAQVKAAGAEVLLGDIRDSSTRQEVVANVQAIISTLGAEFRTPPDQIRAIEYEGVAGLIDAAKAAGVSLFVLITSIGTASQPAGLMQALGPFLQAKREAELYLEKSGLPYIIIRPGGLTDQPGGNPVKVDFGDRITGQISRADLATVTVQALTTPRVRNLAFEVINTQGEGGPDLASALQAAEAPAQSGSA